jgi:predicted transcriptional regulator of viral defense system
MIKRGENMIITNDIAKNNYDDYLNKDTKLSREMRDGKLFRIINGLYETDPNTPGYLLATSIYGPSYISFEYALSFYGLIPERVTTITCATFDKKKKKEYITDFGVFTYRDVPATVYHEEIILKEEKNYSYQIATPEKALCDKLYTLSPLFNYSNLENMLFNDLRIDEEIFKKLDIDKICKLSKLYHSTNVELLAKYMRRNINE